MKPGVVQCTKTKLDLCCDRVCAGGKVAVVIVRVSRELALFAQYGLEIRPLKALNAPSAKTVFPRISSFVTAGITSC